MSLEMKITVPSAVLEFDKKQLRAALRAAGGEVAAVARKLIRSSAGGGRSYLFKGRGRYTASAPGQAPVNISGKLAASIKVSPSRSGDLVRITDTDPVALFLEGGAKGGGGNTSDRSNILLAGGRVAGGRVRGKNRLKASAISQARVLAPRPFLSTALAMREGTIGERVKAAVIDGIRFKRLKA